MTVAELGIDRRQHASRQLVELQSRVVWGDAIKSLPRPAPLIDGVLDLDSLALLFGRSGSGKSFVALDWAMCVATGTWWRGYEVVQAPVLYVAAEGAAGLGARVDAWQRYHGVRMAADITWVPGPIDLLNARYVEALAMISTDCEAKLVVIDTLSRCMAGADENSPRDMTAAVGALDTIREATGACTAPVHHTGKDLSAGARGHSALRAALDTEIRVEGGDGIVTLRADKQRHHADGHVVAKLELVVTGESCALGEYRGGIDAETRALNDNERVALDALTDIEIPGGISYSEWKRASVAAGVADGSFGRIRRRLLDRGDIINVGTNKSPRYATAISISVGVTEVS
jgi:AAA domain